MGLIWTLIIGALIGTVGGAITNTSMGWIANILAGLVGSWLGEMLLGTWGPQLAGMALIPSMIGAVIVVILVSWLVGRIKNN